MTEVFYDQHRHWPVAAGEECVNKKLCKYMADNTNNHNEVGINCLGTKRVIECWSISA